MYIEHCYVRLSISFPFRLFYLIITDIRVAVEMRGLGLVAVLLCVALVLGIIIAMAADPVLVKQHACLQDRDKQARSPAKANCSPPQFLGSALKVRKTWLISTYSYSGLLSQDQRGSSIKATTTFIVETWLPIRRSNMTGWTAATSAGEEKGKKSALLGVIQQSGNTVWTWFPWRLSGKMTTFKTG